MVAEYLPESVEEPVPTVSSPEALVQPMRFTAHCYEELLASTRPDVRLPTYHDCPQSMSYAWALPVAEIHLDMDSALWAEPEDRTGYGIADIGCTKNVGGTDWFVACAERMRRFGLRPVHLRDETMFRGIGGSSRRAKSGWKLPIGVYGAHDVACMAEIEGEMPMLISVWQLASWGSHMDVKRNVHSFEKLDVHDVALPRSTGGHFLVDLCQYGEDPASDPLFAEFLVEPQEQALLAVTGDTFEAFEVRDEEEAYWNSVESAIDQGQWRHALSGADRRACAANVRAIAYRTA